MRATKQLIVCITWSIFLSFSCFPLYAQNQKADSCFRVVLKGESLFDVAKEYSVTISSLCKDNGIDENKTVIFPGQRLVIITREEQKNDTLVSEIQEPLIPKRNLFLVTIGVDSIRKMRGSHLRYAVKGALDVQTYFESQEGGLYQNVITLSITGFPTKLEILEQIKAFSKQIVNPNDLFVLYIGSHGYNDSLRSEFWMLPYDFNNQDTLVYNRNAISANEMLDAIRTPSCENGKKILLLDICNSEGFMQSVAKDAIKEMEVCVMAACGTSENAIEAEKWGNSSFVYALLETQNETFRMSSQKWNMTQLFEYIKTQVDSLTIGSQKPKFILNTLDDEVIFESH